jgi:thiol-disulfide isomerase/thioredoxin
MRALLASLWLVAFVSVAGAGNLPPLTVNDISLMLRSGYSSEAVEREASARHVIGTLDAAAEKKLTQAGASPGLVKGLKAGAFAVPASEAAAVKADLAAKEANRARQLEESRRLDTLYQARVAQARNAAAANPVAKPGAIAPLVKGDLVTSRNGLLHPYLDAEFEKKKLIALYFSAHWCAPCRKFTPALVAFYNRNASAHPEFEVLLVSNDKSAAAMEASMRDEQMPWPALTFDKINGNEGLRKYAGAAIPCLVVVDDTGKVILDTYAGANYRGPEAVLSELDQLWSSKEPSQLARAR